MGDEIKSALEIALEKAEKIGKASKEELRQEKLEKEGRRLAARFLQEKDFNLLKALAEVPSEDKPVVLRAAVDTLVRNIVFPRDELTLKEIEKALKGLETIFIDFPQVRELSAEIKKLLTLYLQQQKQLFEQFKMQFQSQMGEIEEALKQQYGQAVKIEPEMLPQFQEEWGKVKGQLDAQYQRQLDYLKNLFYKMLP
ncbi:DUF6657 family protein [Thermodesulfatator autotrophicus]|uniref:Uncharacterized protein n=1 Tax=Thermodesulfatator autotrophicus TaxID=1795632 RepID=A0A177E893_9BACT|nr:DUF6657 family protein [Thermodesulfatator autotrophicus]OAG28177.1 hypothetical protein TH606_03285 [Thermodesulfatator autotrophicus]